MESLRSLPSVIWAVVAAVLMVALTTTGAYAQGSAEEAPIEDPDITVQVAGLSCPFCAYGLEKKLGNLEGVRGVGVLLEEGEVHLKLEEGATLTEKQIRTATKKAGFEAKKVVFANEEVRAPEGG